MSNQEHLALLVRLYAFLQSDEVQDTMSEQMPILVSDIEAYFSRLGLDIDHGERHGWGLFPIQKEGYVQSETCPGLYFPAKVYAKMKEQS